MLGRFHRSTRTETADGFESNFALYYLSRFLFSHGLAGLMQRAEHPVVLNFGGAGLTGPVRWDDPQLRRRYPGTGALGHSAALCDLLGVSFTATHADPPIRYVLNHPGVVVTSFSGEYDAETAAQVDLLKVTGKAGHAGRSPDPAVPRRPARPAHSSAGGPPSAHRQPRVRPCSRRAPARGDRATARRPPRVAHPRHALAPGPPAGRGRSLRTAGVAPAVGTVSVIKFYDRLIPGADISWTEATPGALTKETAVDKYDIKKTHKEPYSPPSKEFTVVDVPEFRYIAVDGRGDPNTAPAYANALEALYGVAYALKFASKKTLGRDFVVGPLEGLWRADDPTAFVTRRKETWEWTMMISQPDWITEDMVRAAIDNVSKKKDAPALGDIRLLTLIEGTCVQILHIGSYDDETPTLDRLHNDYLPENGLTFNGDHHEIYLSDARRTAPAKLKTILRQPVKTV